MGRYSREHRILYTILYTMVPSLKTYKHRNTAKWAPELTLKNFMHYQSNHLTFHYRSTVRRFIARFPGVCQARVGPRSHAPLRTRSPILLFLDSPSTWEVADVSELQEVSHCQLNNTKHVYTCECRTQRPERQIHDAAVRCRGCSAANQWTRSLVFRPKS